jgi:hypothetical protein
MTKTAFDLDQIARCSTSYGLVATSRLVEVGRSQLTKVIYRNRLIELIQ